MRKHKILFLAADPAGLPGRRLDEQARQIEHEIRLASHRDSFELIPRLAARPLDLLRELRTMKPSIVHFSGHPGIDGIYLEDERRRPRQVTPTALHDTFGAAGQSVQIVVLNGCGRSGVGQALCDFVPICVATSATRDAAARAFSVGFYGALASQEPVARASLQGRAAMSLVVTGEHDRPRIHRRGDIDPETFLLADHVASLGYLASFSASNIQRTIAQHTQALAADPLDRDALRGIVSSFLTLGQFDVADRYARQLIDRHPADPAGYGHRAICLFKGRRPRTASLAVVRDAEQLLDTARQLDPTSGYHDALLAAIRHDYYVLNGLRVPAPAPGELAERAIAKNVNRREIAQACHLLKLDAGPAGRRFNEEERHHA